MPDPVKDKDKGGESTAGGPPEEGSFEDGMKAAMAEGMGTRMKGLRRALSDEAIKAVADGMDAREDDANVEGDEGQDTGGAASEQDAGPADAGDDADPQRNAAGDAAPGEGDPPPDGEDADPAGSAGDAGGGGSEDLAAAEQEIQRLRTENGRYRAQLQQRQQAGADPDPSKDEGKGKGPDERIAKMKAKAEEYREADPDLADFMDTTVQMLEEQQGGGGSDRELLARIRRREESAAFEQAVTDQIGDDLWKSSVRSAEFGEWVKGQAPVVQRAFESGDPADAAWLVGAYRTATGDKGGKADPAPRRGNGKGDARADARKAATATTTRRGAGPNTPDPDEGSEDAFDAEIRKHSLPRFWQQMKERKEAGESRPH